ncbi:uncharacterized protein N7496_005866 [Penicillium cataractarum]|uniref:Uncharacterized protein n=1 Tax=Penicillium cataractarum TaxID=2100454 RepID=A0A9W9V6U5_9EURO|nr:uncharacterized protein N7496_005866 [Penicillium cataractarum]KAJ5369774.1 hypothetical protein N7496_005866 [Penicillium cataractarum]
MSDQWNGAEDSSVADSVLILESESNYAPWIHFLLRYLGPEYWKVLLKDECTLMPPTTVVRSIQTGSSGSHTPSTPAHDLDASQSPNTSPDQCDNGKEDKSSEALFYLRSTLNDEAKYLIRNIDSPSEAFRKIKLFYGKPRHQTMALRWSKWVRLRYFRGHGAQEFVRQFGERLQEVEEISDIVDHRVVFAQFVHAISGPGNYPAFLLNLSLDFDDPNLMECVCAEFLRHESPSFNRSHSSVGFTVAPPPNNTTPSDFWNQQYCPYHRRLGYHSHYRCRLGQSLGPDMRKEILQQFEREKQLYRNKKRRLDACEDSKLASPTG